MFKTVITIDSNGNLINSIISSTICNMIRGEIIVTTPDYLKFITDMGQTVLEVVTLIDIKSTIRYLSNKYPRQTWWILCDYEMQHKLIINGIITDVYLVRSFIHTSHLGKFDIRLSKFDFNLVSIAPDFDNINYSICHYFRRNHEESILLAAMHEVISTGFIRPNRTGVSTRSIFGKQFEYMMVERINPDTGKSSYRFPMLTTKKMFVRGVFAELQWFLNGDTDSKILEAQGVNIWKGNSSTEYLNNNGLGKYREGECGPIYGHQWRSWSAPYVIGKTQYRGEGIDQVQRCIDSLKKDPFGRRHIISGWNVDQLDDMALPPCHLLYQFLAHEDHGQIYLTLSMYQRSADMFLGVPFNVCSMGMFLMMMAHTLGYKPYKIVHSIGDLHIYETHVDAVNKQLDRAPCMFPYISISCEPKENLEDYSYSEINIEGYSSHPSIKADMVA